MKQEKRGKKEGCEQERKGEKATLKLILFLSYKGLQSRKKETNTSKLNRMSYNKDKDRLPWEHGNVDLRASSLPCWVPHTLSLSLLKCNLKVQYLTSSLNSYH